MQTEGVDISYGGKRICMKREDTNQERGSERRGCIQTGNERGSQGWEKLIRGCCEISILEVESELMQEKSKHLTEVENWWSLAKH